MNDFKRRTQRDLGVAVMLLRVMRGWKKGDLARAAGMPTSLIAEVEGGEKMPELQTLDRLLAAMGLSLDALESTRTLIETVRDEIVVADAGSAELPPDRTTFDAAGDPLFRFVSPADLNWEVAKMAAEAGRALSRLNELVLALMSRVTQAQKEEARNGSTE